MTQTHVRVREDVQEGVQARPSACRSLLEPPAERVRLRAPSRWRRERREDSSAWMAGARAELAVCRVQGV